MYEKLKIYMYNKITKKKLYKIKIQKKYFKSNYNYTIFNLTLE